MNWTLPVAALLVIALIVGIVVWQHQRRDSVVDDPQPRPTTPAAKDSGPADAVRDDELNGVVHLTVGKQLKVLVGSVNPSARIYSTIAYDPDPAIAKAEMTTVPKQSQNPAPGDATGYNVIVIDAVGPGETSVRYGQCPIDFQRGAQKCLDNDGKPVWNKELKIVVA